MIYIQIFSPPLYKGPSAQQKKQKKFQISLFLVLIAEVSEFIM